MLLALVLTVPAHLPFARATRSLTLDMLRRNGRRKAPRSAPHRASQESKYHRSGSGGSSNSNTSDRKKGSAPHTTDDHAASSSREDEDYRRHCRGDPSSSSSRSGDIAAVVDERPAARGAGVRRRRNSSSGADMSDSRTSNSEEDSEEQDENTPTAEDNIDDEEKGDTSRGGKTWRREPLTTLEAGSREGGTTSVTATAPTVDSSPNTRPRSAPTTESIDGIPPNPDAHTRTGSDASAANVPDSDEDDASRHLSSSHSPAGPLLEDIELVNLHNLSLHKLEGMERLVFVRVADLSGNELHDTAPLRSCACLEVCVLHENKAYSPLTRSVDKN